MAKLSGVSGVRLEVDKKSLNNLQRACKLLGDGEMPFLVNAFERVGREFVEEVRRRAKGGIANRVEFRGVSKGRGNVVARGRVVHPGSRSMEFGRQYYYFGYTGRRMKSGRKRQVSPGQIARPYVGIVNGDAATAAVAPRARAIIAEAVSAEWKRAFGDGGLE